MPEVSPDGHWLAYQSDESTRSEVYLSPFPDVSSSKRQLSTNGGTRPLWSKSKDRSELFYYVEPGAIWAVPVTLGANLTLGKPIQVVRRVEAARAGEVTRAQRERSVEG